MTDRLSDLWQRQNENADFSDPGACQARLETLERRVNRRNLIEYVAGGLIIAACAIGLVATLAAGLFAYAIAALALMVGTGLVIRHLHAHGRVGAVHREEACLDHLRRQLERQRDLLRSVPGWYLFPLVPGMLAFYAATIIEATPRLGLTAALGEIALPFGWTIAFFVLVAWLNLRSARQLDRQIDRLDA